MNMADDNIRQYLSSSDRDPGDCDFFDSLNTGTDSSTNRKIPPTPEISANSYNTMSWNEDLDIIPATMDIDETLKRKRELEENIEMQMTDNAKKTKQSLSNTALSSIHLTQEEIQENTISQNREDSEENYNQYASDHHAPKSPNYPSK